MTIKKRLEAHDFTLAAELSLPAGLAWDAAKAQALELRPRADLIVIADNPWGMPGFSPLLLAASLAAEWPEVVMEVNLRDRNRVALESDLKSAAAAGVKNFLVSTGAFFGEQGRREAKSVHDLDPVQLVRLLGTEVPGLGITLSVVEQLLEMTPHFFSKARQAGAGQ